ncbi:FAD-binding oxidoreductase [Inhella crocodyli]|uniref:FAD-binding oxidoreductase n=1 Tax=Inhella crocodyli TaxID=2499851 RepID=A0A3S3TC29_9BURK|nr:FAD-binding oxidoreductase [Inhella crocodyli]RVT87731.1 FAD-binding oxidoreductase [Inhella crocodyli]
MTTSLRDALDAWRQLLGAPRVDDGDRAWARYGADTTAATRQLGGALRAASADQVPEIVRIASRFGVPVHPISTGRNWGYGSALPVNHGCVILDLGELRRIVAFDAELGVVTVEPGVTQADLAQFLAQAQHDFLVPVSGAGGTASLLANALERGYGVTPHTDHFAAVTWMEVVLADGTVHRGMLHEAGGPELASLFRWGLGMYTQGLFTQSGLGIVTQMSIALARRPESVAVCLFSLKDEALLEAAAVAIRQAMQRLHPTLGAVNLMNRHRVLSMSAPYPWDHLDAQGLIDAPTLQALGRQFQVFPWTGFATLYGTRRMVRAAQAELRQLLGGIASRLLFVTPRRADTLARLARWVPGASGRGLQRLTQSLRSSLELVAGRPNETALPLAYWRHRHPERAASPKNPAADGCGLIWYAPLVPMRADAVRRYAEMVGEVTRAHGLEPLITFTTLGDRVFDSTVPLVFDRSDPAACARAQACWHALLARGREAGFFPYRFPIQGMEPLRQLAPESCALSERIHRSLDPQGLIAPGRYR